MESPRKYINTKIEKPAEDKVEQKPEVIINVIRHGETDYEQSRSRFHKAPMLNAGGRLDLNEEGIESIKAAFTQIAEMMDKENEVALIISSPAWRTHSSALVGEKVLREKGVKILNAEQKPKFSKAINQHSYFFEKVVREHSGDSDLIEKIIADYMRNYKEGLKSASKSFGGVDIQEEMNKAENLSFQKFLRHMNNIYTYLKSDPKTGKKLNGKKLRIIVLAHEETTRGFIKEVMPEGTVHNKGQILEIIPQSKLLAGQKVYTKVILHPSKQPNSQRQSQIEREFRPE